MRNGKGLLFVLLICWLPSSAASNYEIGKLVVHSAPNEGLHASILIGMPSTQSADALRIRLADESTYQRRGLQRSDVLASLRIALLARGDGQAQIQLSSDTPWRGEGLDILLLIDSGQQQQLASFKMHAIKPNGQNEDILVSHNETLDSVAQRLASLHNRSYLHMMYALYLANPDAFLHDNMNNLRGGVRLRIPTTEELYRFDDAEAFAAIRAHQQQWRERPLPTQKPPNDNSGSVLNLDRDHQELLADLEDVSSEEARIAEHNALLRAQLTELESRVNQIGARLFEQPTETEQQPDPTQGSASEALTEPTIKPSIDPRPQGETTSPVEPVVEPVSEPVVESTTTSEPVPEPRPNAGTASTSSRGTSPTPLAKTLTLPNWLFVLLALLVIASVLLMQQYTQRKKAAG